MPLSTFPITIGPPVYEHDGEYILVRFSPILPRIFFYLAKPMDGIVL